MKIIPRLSDPYLPESQVSGGNTWCEFLPYVDIIHHFGHCPSINEAIFMIKRKSIAKSTIFAILFQLTDYLNPDKSTVYVIGGNVVFFRKAIM